MSLSLLPYQEEGVRFLSGRQFALLADDPGLGKTAQVLRALPKTAPVLVICPKVAKGVWKAEAAKWISPSHPVTICAGKASARYPMPGEIVIMTYDSADISRGTIQPGTVLVADEAHMVKAGNNKRCALFRTIARAVQWAQGKIWLLTGTPMPNNPEELWNLLEYTPMAATAWGSQAAFMRAFSGTKVKTAYGITTHWGQPTEAARTGFAKVALRRRRHQVLTSLPPKFRQQVPVPLTKEALHSCNAMQALLDERGLSIEDLVQLIITSNTRGLPGEIIATARLALATAKIPALLEHVEEAEDTRQPLVVFSAHRAPILALAGRPGWGVITGDTSATERTRLVAEFQAGNLKGIAATIKAAGVALTLTKSSRCVFVDRDWTPANNSQAEARLQRIGQKSNVLVIDLVCEHELDRRVYATLIRKQAIIEAVVGNG